MDKKKPKEGTSDTKLTDVEDRQPSAPGWTLTPLPLPPILRLPPALQTH